MCAVLASMSVLSNTVGNILVHIVRHHGAQVILQDSLDLQLLSWITDGIPHVVSNCSRLRLTLDKLGIEGC